MRPSVQTPTGSSIGSGSHSPGHFILNVTVTTNMPGALRRLSRLATSTDLEVKWGARFRRPLLVWVYVQHLMTFVYFGLLGAMHLTLDLGMRVAMRSYASGPSGALLVLTGVLHCWPFLPQRGA
ncbi:hypothetical protein SPRG_11451 [Saprolegnia parasitica CBS 223.65]|uniref:Uncharacterized protein n=1 Tax=Saprolegnia parasitica (strain CBS 223.65) TaxID=695850 RepID=A0A067BXV4_SAPPC|nr:hypothetical protein SPRG_11451 [Saprolegnia parasitica CBS 223.65]KDO23359.1 hypothetical protein SPRG_11451 [Saprolegnia parasitica CBS 223.65]|eukprot:XP_012205850.1 hypothetical protein SPRG_11451 [Saprolegnia parasitica CBS 223.65]